MLFAQVLYVFYDCIIQSLNSSFIAKNLSRSVIFLTRNSVGALTMMSMYIEQRTQCSEC